MIIVIVADRLDSDRAKRLVTEPPPAAGLDAHVAAFLPMTSA
jgi:hypothetical protein